MLGIIQYYYTIFNQDSKPATEARTVEARAPGIIARKSVYQSLLTGIIAIDAMIPIGRGQRELIIGDRGVGKSSIAVETIANQKHYNKDESEKTPNTLFCVSIITEVLKRLFLGSVELHTLQSHAITGTPCEVPVPRKVIFTR